MVLPDYYDYINILAFKYLFKYENKRSISIETLHKFRSELIKCIISDYTENQEWWLSEGLKQKEDDKLSFEEIDENKKLIEFLDDYKDFFYMKNKQIILKNHISYVELEELEITLRNENDIPYKINLVEESYQLKKILNIHTIDHIVNNYLKVEKQLEQNYNQLYTEKDNDQLKDDITKLLNIRAAFYIKLATLPKQTIDAFRLHHMGCDDYNIQEYEESPIKITLYMQSEYFDEDDFMSDLEDRIYDIYQYAIFGKAINELYVQKLDEDLDKFYFFESPKIKNEEMDSLFLEDPFEDQISDVDENKIVMFMHDPSEEEWIFNLLYLDKLNKYMDQYGKEESLLNVKRRLLYALDKPNKKIFKEENLQCELEKLDLSRIDEDSFRFFQDEYLFLADEVFETDQDENTVKKLLLLSTYYDLTKNEEIVEIIDEHKHHEAYNAYYQIVFGKEKGKIKEKK